MTPPLGIVVLIPVYNDWEAAGRLVSMLDGALAGIPARVLLVDDGSSEPASLGARPIRSLEAIDILYLRRNLGHQRAIAVGLHEIHSRMPCSAVVVMDGDGEDRPEDVPRLLAEFARLGGRAAVFAARTRRMESFLFQAFYRLYRALHWLLTGRAVRVGNFSVLAPEVLGRLMVMPELWNHFAAAVFRARVPVRTLALARGRRLCGASRMNFHALLLHGLAAISVFGDIVSARLLCAASALLALLGAALAATLAVRLGTNWAIPGWATTAAGLLAVLILQTVVMASLLAFSIIGSRSQLGFLAARDAEFFVLRRAAVHPKPEQDGGGLARLGEALGRASLHAREAPR